MVLRITVDVVKDQIPKKKIIEIIGIWDYLCLFFLQSLKQINELHWDFLLGRNHKHVLYFLNELRPCVSRNLEIKFIHVHSLSGKWMNIVIMIEQCARQVFQSFDQVLARFSWWAFEWDNRCRKSLQSLENFILLFSDNLTSNLRTSSCFSQIIWHQIFFK